MICEACKSAGSAIEITVEAFNTLHGRCKGGTHCDCQHRPTVNRPDGSVAQVKLAPDQKLIVRGPRSKRVSA